MVEVRALTPDDWALTRATRLAALADAPDAFGSTYAEAVDRSPAEWRQLLHPANGVRALAEVDGEPAGLIGAFATGGIGEVIWVWVDPAHRGRGVGDALVQYAVDWCAPRGLGCALWVVELNEPARRLYERRGFVATGERKPLDSDPTRLEIRMVLGKQ